MALQAEMASAGCPSTATRDCLFLAHLVSLQCLKAVANPGVPGGLDRLPRLAAAGVRHGDRLVQLRPDLPLALHEAAHARIILGDFAKAQVGVLGHSQGGRRLASSGAACWLVDKWYWDV
jgi:hypothetical protein